jgi:hypothetical protein
VKVIELEPAILRKGSGSTRLTLINDGSTELPVNLSTGIFTDQTSRAKVEAPTVTFALEAGQAHLPATLGPGKSVQISAQFSGFSGSIVADAALFNGGVQIGKLTVVEADTALNIAIDGNGTPDKKLDFSYHRSAIITLKNSGKEFLKLDWRFFLGGTQEKYGTVTMAPNGIARVIVSPTEEVYSPVDFVRPSNRTGVLLLRPHAPEGSPEGLFPTLTLPVSLTMMRSGPVATEVYFALYVMFLLFCGGLFSLLASTILPNAQRRINIEKQIGELADLTSSVSTRVDSHMRVLLRLERKKIETELKQVSVFSLLSGNRVDAAAAGVDRLTRRLNIAVKLDELRRRFENASASAPPSAMDSIDQILQTAGNSLHSYALPEDDVNVANALLAKATLALDALEDGTAQAQLVSSNFKQLQARLKNFPEGYQTDLVAALPGVFEVLTHDFSEPANIVRPMLFAIDHGIAAAQIALDYAMVRASIAKPKDAASVDPGKEIRARVLARESKLIELLGILSWKSLRAAKTMVQEMRENVYEEDVFKELAKLRATGEKTARIVFDTQKARPLLPVFFSIAFDDIRFKNAAALSRLTFRWHFPGQLFEEGLKVCHYFQGDEPALRNGALLASQQWQNRAGHEAEPHAPEHAAPTSWLGKWWSKKDGKKKRRRPGRCIGISVTVQSPNDLQTTATIEDAIELEPTLPRKSHRALVEATRFSIAYVVALVGLEAGALDQLAKLDFLPATLAVIALGFGADSIKNLLAQPAKKPN